MCNKKGVDASLVVSARAFHLCYSGSIPARCSCRFHLVACGKSAFSLTLPNIECFLWLLRIPLVVTLDQLLELCLGGLV